MRYLLPKIGWRMLRGTHPRLLWKFVVQAGWQGMLAVNRFERRLRQGRRFPAFIFISLTNNCNLTCQGCWVSRSTPPVEMEPETFDRILRESKEQKCGFFGILGGEPLLYPGLLELLGRHRDSYFQLFTNGTLITDSVADEMRRLGNITPLVSIEGLEKTSDERRGGDSVYHRSMAGVQRCVDRGLITGVASSVCQSNFEEVVTETFVRDVMALGVQYLWYYIYRPAGPDPCPELALSAEQIVALRRFIVDVRTRVPLVVIDAYWDDKGRALCPAAMGISYHVNPSGDIEPCPPIQFAVENVSQGAIGPLIEGSEFLAGFSEHVSKHTRGCVLLEHPQELKAFVEASGARATSGRPDGVGELAAMCSHPGHHQPGSEIPEKTWFYRLAKRKWFFGFGAYG